MWEGERMLVLIESYIIVENEEFDYILVRGSEMVKDC